MPDARRNDLGNAMIKRGFAILLAAGLAGVVSARAETMVQAFRLDAPDRLALVNVTAAAADFAGVPSMRVQVDPAAKPGSGDVDTATFALVTGTEDFHDGVIEVTLESELSATAPPAARGFVGLAFRIAGTRNRFEAIYLRPTNGRADDPVRRQRATQYMSFPGYDFTRLRAEAPGRYESAADIGPREWVRVRIEIAGAHARLYLNDAPQPILVIDDLKMGPDATGPIGLWVYNGTVAHFRDLRVTRR
jgi:hypothetical protein